MVGVQASSVQLLYSVDNRRLFRKLIGTRTGIGVTSIFVDELSLNIRCRELLLRTAWKDRHYTSAGTSVRGRHLHSPAPTPIAQNLETRSKRDIPIIPWPASI